MLTRYQSYSTGQHDVALEQRETCDTGESVVTHGGDSRTALYIFDTKNHTKLPLTAWKRPKPNCMQL